MSFVNTHQCDCRIVNHNKLPHLKLYFAASESGMYISYVSEIYLQSYNEYFVLSKQLFESVNFILNSAMLFSTFPNQISARPIENMSILMPDCSLVLSLADAYSCTPAIS